MTGKPPLEPRRAHLGTWRALPACPAMTGSLLLLVFLLGGTRRWEAPVLLVWLAVGVLTLTARGERAAVTVLCRFRRPSSAERAGVEPILIAVLGRCGLTADDVDLYVRNTHGINAYAAGRRSIAVTGQVVTQHCDGRLSDDVLAGLLSHEIGHIVTHAVRWSLVTAWLSMPWRTLYRVGARLAAPLAARQPRVLLTAVTLAAFAIAIAQAAEQHAWASAFVLAALPVCWVISPVADAAISRAAEHEADRFAAQVGYGEALGRALRAARTSETRMSGSSLLRQHPAIDRRVRRLELAVGDPAVERELRVL
jgi:Zn-dependent protease with chaperone function